MLRIYENSEMSKGYKDTIKLNGIDINKVKYILIPEDGFKTGIDIALKLSEDSFVMLTTITDISFYVVIND